jgi:hypothetical protein
MSHSLTVLERGALDALDRCEGEGLSAAKLVTTLHSEFGANECMHIGDAVLSMIQEGYVTQRHDAKGRSVLALTDLGCALLWALAKADAGIAEAEKQHANREVAHAVSFDSRQAMQDYLTVYGAPLVIESTLSNAQPALLIGERVICQ